MPLPKRTSGIHAPVNASALWLSVCMILRDRIPMPKSAEPVPASSRPSPTSRRHSTCASPAQSATSSCAPATVGWICSRFPHYPRASHWAGAAPRTTTRCIGGKTRVHATATSWPFSAMGTTTSRPAWTHRAWWTAKIPWCTSTPARTAAMSIAPDPALSTSTKTTSHLASQIAIDQHLPVPYALLALRVMKEVI